VAAQEVEWGSIWMNAASIRNVGEKCSSSAGIRLDSILHASKAWCFFSGSYDWICACS
jgi:hypothetical protein